MKRLDIDVEYVNVVFEIEIIMDEPTHLYFEKTGMYAPYFLNMLGVTKVLERKAMVVTKDFAGQNLRFFCSPKDLTQPRLSMELNVERREFEVSDFLVQE